MCQVFVGIVSVGDREMAEEALMLTSFALLADCKSVF